jgi:undecaprenyl-diphosphatase
MSILEAILLGIVQGLTEFLPISSSGHLILVPWAQDYTFLRENPDFNKTFDVALHIGTLIGVVYYFRRELWAMVRGFARTLTARAIEDADGRLAWLVLIATIPAVIVGGLGEEWIDDNLGEPWMIGIQLIVFGLLLGLADRLPQRVETREVTIRQGIVIGLAQAVSLAPGTSRSGITITAGRFLGLTRDAAAKISFLLLVPATAGDPVQGLRGGQRRAARRGRRADDRRDRRLGDLGLPRDLRPAALRAHAQLRRLRRLQGPDRDRDPRRDRLRPALGNLLSANPAADRSRLHPATARLVRVARGPGQGVRPRAARERIS